MSGREIILEWINEKTAMDLFRKRIKEAEVAKGPEAVAGQSADAIWDWVEIEEAACSRRFPNIALAKAHVSRNPGLDMYGRPRIVVTEPLMGDESDWQTVLELEFDGTVWMDTKTGVPA